MGREAEASLAGMALWAWFTQNGAGRLLRADAKSWRQTTLSKNSDVILPCFAHATTGLSGVKLQAVVFLDRSVAVLRKRDRGSDQVDVLPAAFRLANPSTGGRLEVRTLGDPQRAKILIVGSRASGAFSEAQVVETPSLHGHLRFAEIRRDLLHLESAFEEKIWCHPDAMAASSREPLSMADVERLGLAADAAGARLFWPEFLTYTRSFDEDAELARQYLQGFADWVGPTFGKRWEDAFVLVHAFTIPKDHRSRRVAPIEVRTCAGEGSVLSLEELMDNPARFQLPIPWQRFVKLRGGLTGDALLTKGRAILMRLKPAEVSQHARLNLWSKFGPPR